MTLNTPAAVPYAANNNKKNTHLKKLGRCESLQTSLQIQQPTNLHALERAWRPSTRRNEIHTQGRNCLAISIRIQAIDQQIIVFHARGEFLQVYIINRAVRTSQQQHGARLVVAGYGLHVLHLPLLRHPVANSNFAFAAQCDKVVTNKEDKVHGFREIECGQAGFGGRVVIRVGCA